MPKPITPFVGCETLVLNDEGHILLAKRSEDNTWCMPGGAQDLGETPAQAAVREMKEETGFDIKIVQLIGVFSSLNYTYVHYLWKENEFVHLLFLGKLLGGSPRLSNETSAIDWFDPQKLPLMLDGHEDRIRVAFEMIWQPGTPAHFE